ncbi:MAG: DUF6364 family protein [Candidatus Dormibacteraceae bacterium]
MKHRNLTIAVPEEVYRAARVRAAQSGTSVSALVGDYLRSLTAASSGDFADLEGRQRRITAEIERFRGADRLSRHEVHERAIR